MFLLQTIYIQGDEIKCSQIHFAQANNACTLGTAKYKRRAQK
jgi:hypothetical protein